MPQFAFRRAVRENVALLLGLMGGTGSGKTYTAMLLAKGHAGTKPFAVIDTEAGRAKHYADDFTFDHGDLAPPFTPDRYWEAIKAADDAGYPVIVVDSMSHEHAGTGGLLEWHEAELDRMAKDDWAKRERVNQAAWIKPKMAHKSMMSKLLQIRAHLILCFRAEEKVEQVKDASGKTVFVPKKSRSGKDGWIPICEKSVPFELTTSVLLLADRPGVPLHIKVEKQHQALFPLDTPITEESGRAIAAWAAGGTGERTLQLVDKSAAIATEDPAVDKLRRAAEQGSAALRSTWEGFDAATRKRLGESTKDAFKAQAGIADAKRAAEKKAAPPEVTADSVITMMDKRSDIDMLDADATLIDAIADLQERERARNRYHELREKLGQP